LAVVAARREATHSALRPRRASDRSSRSPPRLRPNRPDASELKFPSPAASPKGPFTSPPPLHTFALTPLRAPSPPPSISRNSCGCLACEEASELKLDTNVMAVHPRSVRPLCIALTHSGMLSLVTESGGMLPFPHPLS
jgi:hypothetical protein